MIKRIQHIVCLLVLSCLFQTSFSQTVYVKASINKDKILIGEPILLELEATLPVGFNAKWFSLDSIPHFEFIEQAKIDTVKTREVNTFRQIVTITSFDSGMWVIPAMMLDMNGKSYLTDSLPVSVAFSNFDPSKDYHDIKDILSVENPSIQYINWVLAAITLLSLLAVIYFLRKRISKVPVPQEKTESRLSPVEEALRSLEELRSKQLPENGQVKLYYTSLNDILRLFILRKTSMASMQKTNEELIFLVRDMKMPNENFIAMAQTLRMSDAVKFAKYIPGRDDNEESFQNIKTSIELLNNLQT